MYIPKGFEVEDLDTLYDFMERHSFALLSGMMDGAPFATHLPLLVDRARGAKGTIVDHVARANPHGRTFDGKSTQLAIFAGPHAYVSPNWYASADKVPTWLYTAVHAYGHYVDDFVESAGYWKIARRRFTTVTTELHPAMR